MKSLVIGGRQPEWFKETQQEVKLALEHGMQRYASAMQKLSEGDK
jgi:uncharacterized protein (UPF0548 family)